MKWTATCAAIALAAGTLACDRAERTEPGGYDTTIGTAGIGSGNADFVETSMSAGMVEVELGNLAQQKAASPDVKEFAAMMVRDHTRAGETLKQVAQQHAIQAQPQSEDEHRDLIDRLSRLSGAEFDREYMSAMVDSHQDVVDHLQSRADVDRFGDNKGSVTAEPADNAAEEAVNQWAATTLPTARHHLDEARRIREMVASRQTRAGTN